MSFSDETLMAFADGELDDITRHEVELAMRLNPEIAEKVRQHTELRSAVYGAFSSTLKEDVPQRLQAAARSGKVVHLDSVRQVRTPPPPPLVQKKARWSWPEWGAMAATLVVGVLAGTVGSRSLESGAQFAAFDQAAGALTAQGKLEQALSQQLASAPPGDPNIRVGVSFLSKEGNYCRSFMLPKTAGLACRTGAEWRIPMMANSASGASGAYRQAGSEMPPAVLEAIDELIVGQALDANAEKAALKQGWTR